jgi:hypothetical protein
MKTLRQRADAHHDKGGHDESWLSGYRAAVRDAAKATIRRKLPSNWFDAGYLDNGHCSFMQAMNGKHYCCCLSHGHDGPHTRDPQYAKGVSE